jgi:serine/threonine-protein kinase HipA
MTLNGKRDNFEMADFLSFEKLSPIFNEQRIRQILEEVIEAVSSWTSLAVQSNVPKVLIERVEQNLRLKF